MSWSDQNWRDATLEYRSDNAAPKNSSTDLPRNWDSLTLDALYYALNRAAHERNPAPEKSIVAAIIQSLRECGIAALKEPATAERLSRCTEAQRDALKKTITKETGQLGGSK
jgi:hypothetical protein